MPKIKIAYLIDTFLSDTAGTEKQLMNLIQRLDRDTFEPYIICLWSSPWMKENELPCDVFVLDYKGFIKLNFIIVIRRFISLLKQKQFHIIQTFFEDSLFFGYFGKIFSMKKPILLSNRRDIGLGDAVPWYHAFYNLVMPIVYKQFDGIVVNGNNVKKYVEKGGGIQPRKIKVINNGIIIPGYVEQKPQIFEDNQAQIWIGIVTNLKPVKRIDVFLKALAHLKMICNNMDFKAVVIGDGPERERLQKMAHELKILSRVHFLGTVNNVIAYLKHLDIAVLCSDREGFSNSILEYMACGLPVVVTAVGGNTELVDETNGFCVPPGNPYLFAKAISNLILFPDLRKKMGDRAVIKVKENYTWDRIIKEWENYYQSLLEPKAKVFCRA